MMRFYLSRFIPFCALLVSLGLLPGCSGSGRLSGSGRVTIDGDPLESGSITFLPVDGDKVSAGTEIANGQYSFSAVNGPMAGPHTVIVETLPTGKLGAGVAGEGEVGEWEMKFDVPESGAFEKDFKLTQANKKK